MADSTAHKPGFGVLAYTDSIMMSDIQPGTDKNGAQLLKRLNGVIISDNYKRAAIQTINISGMGERYNQVLLNGAVFNSFDPVSKAYPFSLLPSEAIESVSVQTSTNGSAPADFGGGMIDIKTKDIPERNFFYIQAGAGFFDETGGKTFYGDKRSDFEFLGFPGSQRSLPEAFPTTRSQSNLNQKNPQEQVYLSKLLKNNLAPVDHGTAGPNEKVMIGFGKVIRKKSGTKIGIIAYLNQQRSERIDETTVQVSPDIAGNPFPFDGSRQLVRSQSDDINYRYASQLSGIFNASVLSGYNKISFRNFIGSVFDNVLTLRSGISKPDEDPSAHTGINYLVQQGKFWNSRLSGEHALGARHILKMDWQASYTYYRQQNPDERNFLARQDSTDPGKYEIAQQGIDADFTRSGRGWKEYTDHNFVGSFNLSVPFDLLDRPHLLAGGVYLETRERTYHDDFLLTQGPGYYSPSELLAPERYYPGGLKVTNYFSSDYVDMNQGIDQHYRGNYKASSNLGASFIRLENQLTKRLKLNWGLRLESYNQLVSNVQYYYLRDYKNPQYTSLDANPNVIRFSLLPAVKLVYLPVDKFLVYATYFKTLNRAQLQELSYYSFYDATSFTVKTGNPYLRNSDIQNYDAGFKWLPNAGTSISVSGFYKEIDQPIERILSGYGTGNLLSTPHNTPPATVKGITAAFRVNLSSFVRIPVSLFANGTWLNSRVKAGSIRSATTPEIREHTLTGSPGHTVNAGLVIQHAAYPQLTVLYNRTGDFISTLGSGAMVALNNENIITAIPDYRIQGTDQLDIQVSQKLLASRVQLIAGVHNLLNAGYIEYQDLNGNEKFDDPLLLTPPSRQNGESGYYKGGTDNTAIHQKPQRTFYFTLSYSFN